MKVPGPSALTAVPPSPPPPLFPRSLTMHRTKLAWLGLTAALILTACDDANDAAVPLPDTTPTVTALSPDAGLTGGGTPVTVTGSHFTSGISVRFGTALSSTVTVSSPTTLTAISPAGTVGKVDVTVSNGTVTSKVGAAAQFNYMAFSSYPVPTAHSNLEDITAGPDGNLWFTEFGANQIGRITPSGSITEYPVPTAGGGLWDITAGPDSNLWFTEFIANQIGVLRLGPSRQRVQELGRGVIVSICPNGTVCPGPPDQRQQ